ncbi:MAG TPA: hypothetical protein VEH06_10665 [Candidatus Bathyarchaeia archaeon]|nr:hypothetical protein [Candidatus Bathyarchaeia archaeon]
MSVIRKESLISWGFALSITMSMKKLSKKSYKMIIYDDRIDSIAMTPVCVLPKYY